jgi:hypothetical protein
VTVNPFADLPAPGGEKVARDRFLTAAEIRQIWTALDTPERFSVSREIATALRLILVTAARPGMVRGRVGTELRDLRGSSEHGPRWSQPAERMKAGSAFITPLSGLALELLRPHLKADPAAPIFTIHENHLHEAARQIVAGLGTERWTPHDLRRTAATILDRAGCAEKAQKRPTASKDSEASLRSICRLRLGLSRRAAAMARVIASRSTSVRFIVALQQALLRVIAHRRRWLCLRRRPPPERARPVSRCPRLPCGHGNTSG